ncbi:MAG TPA: nucleoside-diphosphate kinase [Rhizobiaceae bacterium]
MPHDACILTTKDFTILEVMLDRCLGTGDPMRALLSRKIDAATVVFRDDVPPDVATLRSRVTFAIDGREPDTRVLSHDRMNAPIGLYLPITTLRGLALLGLAAGQAFFLAKPDGGEERIVLEAVAYQPEAATRERDALARLATPAARRAALRVIPGTLHGHLVAPAAWTGDPDDPGPSAA